MLVLCVDVLFDGVCAMCRCDTMCLVRRACIGVCCVRTRWLWRGVSRCELLYQVCGYVCVCCCVVLLMFACDVLLAVVCLRVVHSCCVV